MARPLLIIEFSHRHVRAGVFPPSGAAPSAFLSLPIEGKGVRDAVSSALSAVAERGKEDASSSDVFVSVPPSSAILRVVDVPVDKREKINEILPFELAGALSIDTDEAVLDNIPVGGGKAIAVALEKKLLAEYIEAFRAFNADPVWIGVAGFSIPRLLKELHKTAGTAAFIREDFISVSREGRPVFFNSYSGRGGLKLSLKYLEAEGIKIDEVYYSEVKGEEINALVPGVPLSEITLPEGFPPDGAGVAALALELKKGLIKETVNLRKGEFENTREKAAFRKRLRTTGALLLAIAVFALGDAYIRYLTLNNELAAYKKALRSSYSELFPNEKPPADELYQLSIKLKAVEKEAGVVNGGPGVLDLMNRVAVAASREPAMLIRVQEISVAEGRLRVSGEAASFEAANRFKELLSSDDHLKNIQLTDLKSKTGGGAAFSLSLSVI